MLKCQKSKSKIAFFINETANSMAKFATVGQHR